MVGSTILHAKTAYPSPTPTHAHASTHAHTRDLRALGIKFVLVLLSTNTYDKAFNLVDKDLGVDNRSSRAVLWGCNAVVNGYTTARA